jgi:hypothetical protein
MSRRITAVAITVIAVVVAGALRTPGDEVSHDHGGVGPLGAVVALAMMLAAAAVLVAMLLPRRERRR